MSAGAGFVVWFSITLAFLALVFVTGLTARRKVHITCVVLTLASLAMTVRYAYQLGELYDLPAAGWITPVHLTLARVNTFLFLLPIATGLRTLFAPATRRWHRRVAFVTLGVTLLTAATGAVMLWLAPAKGA